MLLTKLKARWFWYVFLAFVLLAGFGERCHRPRVQAFSLTAPFFLSKLTSHLCRVHTKTTDRSEVEERSQKTAYPTITAVQESKPKVRNKEKQYKLHFKMLFL